MLKTARWLMLGMLAVAVWQALSLGQGRLAVFVTAPELTSSGFSGSLGRANFELQGVVPVANVLSFPTAVVCGPGNTLYVAEFSLRSGQTLPNDTPEARIVAYGTDGMRGEIVARIPESFVVGMTISDSGELFVGTGAYPGEVEFTGIWKANPNTPNADPIQLFAPEDFPELLELLETVIDPRAPEVRQLVFVPALPDDRPFAGHLLFTAGAGTLQNWDLYRAPVNGGSVGAFEKVNVGGPWHAVAAGPMGDIFLGDFLNGKINRLVVGLESTEPFTELIEPYHLAVDAVGTVYATTNEFEFDDLPASGKKPSTLWRFDRFDRLPVGASGAWGVTVCE